MEGITLSGRDVVMIEAMGMTKDTVLEQISLLQVGTIPVRLNRPCTVNDGIKVLTEKEQEECIRAYDEAGRPGRVMKFVPASGAASRMFQDWCLAFQEGGFRSRKKAVEFAEDLKKFAFFKDLQSLLHKNGLDFDRLVEEGRYVEILAHILTDKGLNYASLPKALLKFHAYGDESRTVLEEHIVEAVLYTRDSHDNCRMHVTVSPEHEGLVRAHLSGVLPAYEARYGVRLMVEVSVQQASTNTITVDLDNRPVRDRKGNLVFRPGGHGALLHNLYATDGDVIMIKNIDNVVPDRLKEEMVHHKKILGGYLVSTQKKTFQYIEALSVAGAGRVIASAERFLSDTFHASPPAGYSVRTERGKIDYLLGRLNRPVRVCGMVRNEGEPGGGPFWVDEENGSQTIQIVEQAQVNTDSEEQRSIWQSSTHFNPVDIACGIGDHRTRKFDLKRFVDEKAYIISRKMQNGIEIKTLELPGLWNGSMARWNTVFIEVPVETFNPVKTVYDLLRKQHGPS